MPDEEHDTFVNDNSEMDETVHEQPTEPVPEKTGSGPDSKEDEKSLAEKIAALEAEKAELNDRYLRKYAEFENFRKRVIREREEASKYSNSMLLLDITNVIDDFERALKSAEASKDFKKLHSGISLIEKQLITVLEKKWGLERFFAKGAVFDPERHEALMSEQSPSVEQPTVAEDFQSGYLLHGRVLRPAKVKVIQPAGNDDQTAENHDNHKNKKDN